MDHRGNGRRRLASAAVLVLVATGACSRGGLSENLGGGKDVEVRRGSAPRAASAQGASLVVKSVESNDKGVTMELLAINGDDDDLRLSSEYEGLVLEDDTGVKHPAREEEIELRPGTATLLRVDFAGPLPGGARRLALRVESPPSVKLDVEDIPAPGSDRLEFVETLPPPIPLVDRTAHHPNGANLVIRRAEFEDQVIEVWFQAVNGNKGEVKLNESGTFVEDQNGRRYFLVPSPDNRKLAIPGRQRLTGTLRFAGRLAPSAERLTLVFNDKGSADSEVTTSPKITVSEIGVRR